MVIYPYINVKTICLQTPTETLHTPFTLLKQLAIWIYPYFFFIKHFPLIESQQNESQQIPVL